VRLAHVAAHHGLRVESMKTLTALLSVMFMPDQLRYDSLGCTGNPVIRTPHFDSLAKEGTLFTSE
jgi:hypothetical protein